MPNLATAGKLIVPRWFIEEGLPSEIKELVDSGVRRLSAYKTVSQQLASKRSISPISLRVYYTQWQKEQRSNPEGLQTISLAEMASRCGIKRTRKVSSSPKQLPLPSLETISPEESDLDKQRIIDIFRWTNRGGVHQDLGKTEQPNKRACQDEMTTRLVKAVAQIPSLYGNILALTGEDLLHGAFAYIKAGVARNVLSVERDPKKHKRIKNTLLASPMMTNNILLLSSPIDIFSAIKNLTRHKEQRQHIVGLDIDLDSTLEASMVEVLRYWLDETVTEVPSVWIRISSTLRGAAREETLALQDILISSVCKHRRLLDVFRGRYHDTAEMENLQIIATGGY